MKSVLSSHKLSKHKYIQLLIALICNFVLSPFLQGHIGSIALSFIFLYAIVVIVRTFPLKPKLFKLYMTIAFSSFILEIFGRLGFYDSWKLFFLLLIQCVYILYLGGAVYLILQDILFSKKVTIDNLHGAIAVYLLIGFIWGLLYGIIAS